MNPRFRLRSIFVVIACACLVLGWRSSLVNNFREQEKIALQAGGDFTFEPCKEAWLRWFVGSETARYPVEGRLKTGDLAFAKKLPQLRRLYLAGSQIADNQLSQLRGHKSLQVLGLQGTTVTDASIASLVDLKQLRNLDLDNTSVGDTGISYLRNHRSLERLVTGMEVTDQSIDVFNSLPNLKTLQVRKSKSITLAGVKRIKDGVHVDYRYDLVNDSSPIDDLFGNRSMYDLRLDDRGLTDEDLKGISRSDHIVALSLSNNRISDASLKEISQLPLLSSLNLSNCAVSDAGLRHLSTAGKLQMLNLSNCDITDKGLVELSSLKTLLGLKLNGCRVGDEGTRQLLANTPDLLFLELDHTQVTENVLSSIGQLNQLSTLSMSGCRLSEQSVQMLNESPVEILRLRGCGLRDDAVAAFEDLANLRRLDLCQNQITDAGLAALGKTSATELLLCENNIKGPGLAHLVKAPVVHLSLLGNSIASARARSLLMNSSLRYLSISPSDVDKLAKNWLGLHPDRFFVLLVPGGFDESTHRCPCHRRLDEHKLSVVRFRTRNSDEAPLDPASSGRQ